MNTKFYKCCVVPMCESTSIRTPEKLFIHVPKKKQIRRKWLTLARRDPASLSVTTTSYFCEDHFDLANDMENYIEYTTMGVVSQIRMKEGSLPTKFACQPNRARTSDLCRPVAAKRRRLAIIQECEEELDESCSSSTAFEQSTIGFPGTSSDLITTHQQQASTIDKAVQTAFVKIISTKHRSEATQIKPSTKQKQTSPIKPSVKTIPTSPFKVSDLPSRVKQVPVPMHVNMGDEKSDSDVSIYIPSVAFSVPSKASSDTSSINDPEIIKEEDMKWVLKATVAKIEKKPLFYIGVP